MNDNDSGESNKSKVFEVNAQTFLIPLSIILAGIIIAGAIFVSNGNEKTTSVSKAEAEPQGLIDDAIADAQEVTVSVDDDAVLGTKEVGKVAIVEFSDYECPFCKSFKEQTLEQLKKEQIDSGKAFLVYRDLPLDFHEPAATQEAQAAECVRDQIGDEGYFTFHDSIFDNTGSNGVGIPAGKLSELAEESGANVTTFDTCMSEKKFADEIKKDASDAQVIGVNGTPGFIVGKYTEDGNVEGIVISGAQPYQVFESAIKKIQEG